MNSITDLITTEAGEVPAEVERIQEIERFAQELLPCVNDQESYNLAAEKRRQGKNFAKELDEMRKKFTRPLDERKRQITAFFERYSGRLNDAINHHTKLLTAWDMERQLEKEQEQAAINAAMQAKAAAEKLRLEALALKALEKGDERAAVRLVQKSADTRPTEIQLAPHKPITAGVHYRDVWKYEIFDAAALPRAYLVPDEKKLGQLAREAKGQAAVPGVRFYSEKQIITK